VALKYRVVVEVEPREEWCEKGVLDFIEASLEAKKLGDFADYRVGSLDYEESIERRHKENLAKTLERVVEILSDAQRDLSTVLNWISEVMMSLRGEDEGFFGN